MRKAFPGLFIVILLLAVSGCGGAIKENAAPAGVDSGVAEVQEHQLESREQVEEDVNQPGLTQKIIKTVSMAIVVSDVEKAVTEIESLLRGTNGYVQDANLWQDGDRMRGNLTLRVPAEKVDGLIPRLEAQGQVESKNTTGQDVTEEYYDVEARKNNLKKQEERYLELLNKANTVKEMLEIENELARVRGEIESMEARLKVLDNRVSLATINIELQSPGGISTGHRLKDPFGERISDGWQRGVNGMVGFVQDLVVLVVILVPYLPILVLFGYIAYRLNKKWRLGKSGNSKNAGE